MIKLFDFKIRVKKEIFLAGAILVIAIIGVCGYFISRGGSEVIIEAGGKVQELPWEKQPDITDSNKGGSGQNEENIDSDSFIKVYVVGCVKNPGIVEIKKGQLIDDALKAAGGTTNDADLENINLVYKLNENIMLRVLPRNNINPEITGQNSSSAPGSNAGKGIVLILDTGTGVVEERSGSGNSEDKVNINTASMEQLTTLPYIGTETAKDIIAFREKNGLFKTISDIMKVPGIKDNKFSRIKDRITVD